MRVIAGKLKGHQLVAFAADHIRPTTDRIKQSVFNRLAPDMEGARVLDLFSGTGSLAIEAHSQGAAAVMAVENNSKSLRIIRENLKKLKIEDQIQVRPMDVFKFLTGSQEDAFDIVLVDPPFTQKLAHDVLLKLSASQVVKTGSIVVIEASTHERVEDSYGRLRLLDRRDYGDKQVCFFTCA